MADTAKLDVYGVLVRDAFLSIDTVRRSVMVDKIGRLTLQLEEAAASHFKIIENDLGRYVSLPTLESLVQQLREQENTLRGGLIAFNSNLRYHRGMFLLPDNKTVQVFDMKRTDLPEALRLRYIWEALDVTMKRRAAEGDLKAWHQEPTFKVLGVGLYDGELKFVYSYVSPEHGLVLYRLPVREEDLPDLPTAQTAE